MCKFTDIVIALIHDVGHLNARALNDGMIAWSHGLLVGKHFQNDTLTSEMSIELFSKWKVDQLKGFLKRNCFSRCLFSIGTYIRERIEKYTFIDAQIPNCTINGHSSSTGKTLKSPSLRRFAPTISVPGNPQNSIHFPIYISRDICRRKFNKEKTRFKGQLFPSSR